MSEYRRETARTLAEYEIRIKELNDDELTVTFDGMAALLFTLKEDKDRQLACNGLDIIANEMHNRKIKRMN